jgi:UDPglucose 6-dehydrogenase
MENAKKILDSKVHYVENTMEALKDADVALILTEWNEFKDLDIQVFEENMKLPVIFDGRNCYDPKIVENYHVEYHSMGRPSVKNIQLLNVR